MAYSIIGSIQTAAHAEHVAGVYGGIGPGCPAETPEDASALGLSTWQVQQMRRAARARSRLPWREQQVLAEAALAWTAQDLIQRGAWCRRIA